MQLTRIPYVLTFSLIALTGVITFAITPGCASGPDDTSPIIEPETELVAANAVLPDPPPEVIEVEVPVAVPQRRALPAPPPPEITQRNGESGGAGDLLGGPGIPGAMAAIDEANRDALVRSTEDGFVDAIQYYEYLPGAVYEVIASPDRVTTITLRPGEHLQAKAAGDTRRWQVDETVTGRGEAEQTLVIVRPLREWVDTNLVLVTDQRVYQLELRSVPGGVYNAAVSWNYPRDRLVQVNERVLREQEAARHTIAPIDVENLDFAYEITPGDEDHPPRWMPRRVFNDGRKTYIQFPSNLGVTEAPPLFVTGRKGDAELINYRVHRSYYIVDRVLDRAQLRLGDKPQDIVQIRSLHLPPDRRPSTWTKPTTRRRSTPKRR